MLTHITNNSMKIIPKSTYVKAGIDVNDGDWITILSEGKYEPSPSDPTKEILNMKVELPDGQKKLMTINNTSQREIIQEWGDESKNWIGKRCKVEIVVQQVFDKRKGVCYLHPQKEAEDIKDNEIPVEEE